MKSSVAEQDEFGQANQAVTGTRSLGTGPRALAGGLALVLLGGCWVPLERGRQM